MSSFRRKKVSGSEKGNQGTPIRNESEPSSTYFLAESSDKDISAQYLRPNIHPIYQYHGSACRYRTRPKASQPCTRRPSTKALPAGLTMGRSGRHRACAASGGRDASRPPRAAWWTGPTSWPKRGDGSGYAGSQHQQGEHVIVITDTHGAVVAPAPVAPSNATDMGL
jgi:hypothetical protein